jgi:predicted metal-dependent hydrolase
MRTTLPGEPPIELQVRHAPRARRISLRVSARDGRVTLTVPPGATLAEAVGFARDREDWLRRALAGVVPPERPGPSGRLAVEGRDLPVVAARVRAARLDGERLLVPAGRPAGPALAAYLRLLARERAGRSLARHAAAIGRPAPPLRLRDTRSRWGSCSAEGRIMLSWRLAMAPPEVLDYVAAHEVAHLVHMDHSPRFWAVTERLFPGWKASRIWLRKEGGRLQAVDFS